MTYSYEAEQAVLSAVMLQVVAPSDLNLQPEHFHSGQNQYLWKVCHELDAAGVSPDMITVTDRIPEDHPLADAPGIEYIDGLVNDSAVGLSESMCKSYSKIIRDHWSRREIARGSRELLDSLADRDVTDTIGDFDSLLNSVQEGSSGMAISQKDAIRAALDEIDRVSGAGGELLGVTTGLTDLDKQTEGLQKTDLVILAARPSQGKTALSLNLARAALDKGPVFYFSMEMPREKLTMRMMAAETKIHYGSLRKGELLPDDWRKLTASTAALHDLPLLIDDRAGLSPVQVKAACKTYAKQIGDPVLIVVDYLQIMSSSTKQESETMRVTSISGEMKKLAQHYDCPVLLLSQLNRGLESRPNKRPNNSDLRQSGAIEQDADVIMFIYRDEVYHPDTDAKGVAELIISKQREGPTGTVYTSFQGQHQLFSDLYRGDV